MAPNNNGRIQIDAIIDASLKNAITSMGESVQYILRITNDLNRTSMSTKSGVDSLNKALSSGTSASSAYSRATSNLSKNQQVLANHFRKVSIAVDQLQRDINTLNSSSTANASATRQQASASQSLVNSLNSQLAMQKQLQKYSLAQSYKNQAASLTDLSNKYSMSGTRMSLSVSAPIIAFARSAFSTFKRLEVQTVRTTKLIGDSYKSIDEVTRTTGATLAKDGMSYTRVIDGQIQQLYTVKGAMDQLGKTLDSITYKYGISRELVQGLVGDYAELGISSIEALGSLVDLTAATEKLGNVDIGESQAFIQSIYQTVMRVNRDLGKNVSPEDALKEVTGQLAMFNLIENKTSLSLNNLAKGFPELTASATSFGLSMGEATALMVPMVAAGFQVGASANSVKVSLQRLVDLTKENSQLIEGFRQNNKDFTIEAGVGIETIQKLADSYNFLKKSKGEQGTMEMFSNLFGVRQGPRMEVAIQNLAQFQDALTKQGSVERNLADKFEEYIQKNTAGLGDKYSKFQVKKFEDLSTAVELASSKDKATAKAFTKGRQEFAEYIKSQAMAGADVISQISTEAGRALFIAAQGGSEGSEAQRKFLQEVSASLDTAETRYNRAREIIKGIGRQIIPIVGELLKVLIPVLNFVQKLLEKIGPIGKVIIGIGLAVFAAIGPIMKIMGAVFQMRSAFASIRGMNAFGKLKTQAIEVSESMIRSNAALFKMRGGLSQIGNKFFLKATLKEFQQLEKAMALSTGGFFQKRTANKIFKSLGVDKRQANFEGLMPGYKESVKAGFSTGDLSVGQGYMKEVYDAQGNAATEIKTEAAAIGTGIAEAFLEVLRMNGFDTNQVAPPRAPRTPKGGGPGPVQGPPSPPGAGPNSGYPGPGGGSGGSGGSGGKPSRRVSGNKNYQQMIDDIINEVDQGVSADLDKIAQDFDKLVNGIDKFTEDIAEKARDLVVLLQTATQDWDPDNLKILLNNSLQDMEDLFTQRLIDLQSTVTMPVNPPQAGPAPAPQPAPTPTSAPQPSQGSKPSQPAPSNAAASASNASIVIDDVIEQQQGKLDDLETQSETIIADLSEIVAEPDKPGRPARSATEKLADAVKKIEENAQKIFDVAMNPTIEGLESLKRYQLEMIAKLYGLKIGKRTDTNLRQNIMNAVENSVKIDTTLEDIKEKLTKRAGSANSTRGSPKVEDAVDEVTDVVATATQETLADVIQQEGEETKETVKKGGSRSGKGGGTKKTQEASEETSEKVQNATEDKLEEVITKTGEKVVDDIQKDSKNITATVKPKAINLSEIQSKIQAIYDDVFLFLIAKNEKNFNPNQFIEEIGKIDISSLNDEEITSQLDIFVKDILSAIDRNKKDLGNAQKKAYALIEETAIENYALLIQQAQSGLFQKETNVDYFDAKALRGVVRELQGLTEKEAKIVVRDMRVLLETIQKGKFDTETFDEFRQRLLKLKFDIGADLGEFVGLLIAGMQQKHKNASSEDKPGFSTFIGKLKKLQSSMGELRQSVETSIEIEGQAVEGLAIRAKEEAGKSMAIRNRISPTVVGRTTYSFGDESDVDHSRTGGVGGYNIEGADGAGLAAAVDALAQGKRVEEDLYLEEIAQEQEDLKAKIEANKKLLEQLSRPLSKTKKKKGQVKIDESQISQLKKLISEQEAELQSLQEESKSDEVTVSSVEESVLEKVKKRKKRISALTEAFAVMNADFLAQKAKIETIQETGVIKGRSIEDIFSTKKDALLGEIQKAQEKAQENAKLIAELLPEFDKGRNELGSLIYERENSVDKELIADLQTKIRIQEEILSEAKKFAANPNLSADTTKRAIEHVTELEKKLQGLREDLQQADPLSEEIKAKQKQVGVVGKALGELREGTVAPAMMSDDALMRTAIDDFETELEAEKKYLQEINNRRINFSAELRAEHIKYSQMVEQLRATMSGGTRSAIAGVAQLATREGYAELVAAQKEEQEDRIRALQNQMYIERNWLKILKNLREEGSASLAGLSFESLLKVAVNERRELNSLLAREKSKLNSIAGDQGKIRKSTDPDEIKKLEGNITKYRAALDIIRSQKEEAIRSLSSIDEVALDKYSKTIFSDKNSQQVIGFTGSAIDEQINNQILNIEKNSQLEIQKKLNDFKDANLVALKELGFKSTTIGLQELPNDQLRLTPEVFENIAKEFGIVVPEIFKRLGEYSGKINLKFKDELAAKKFVLTLLSRVKPVQEGAKAYIPEIAILDEILQIDKLATQISMGVENFGVDKLGFLATSAKYVREELLKIADVLPREAPAEIKPEKTEAEIAEIKEMFARINSVDQEIGMRLTVFEDQRRRFYFMIARSFTIKFEQAARLKEKLAMVAKLKDLDPKDGVDAQFIPDLQQDIAEIEEVIVEQGKLLAELESNIQRTFKGQINKVRNRILKTQLTSQLTVDAVKGAGIQYSQGKPKGTGVLDIKKLTVDELEERKAPNPFLKLRPQVISEKASVARKEIISLMKALQTAKKNEKPVILNKIKELKIEIDRFQDAKNAALVYLVNDFLRSTKGMTLVVSGTKFGEESGKLAAKIHADLKEAELESQALGLDASEAARRSASVMVESARLVKEFEEDQLRRRLDDRSLGQSLAMPKDDENYPFYRQLEILQRNRGRGGSGGRMSFDQDSMIPMAGQRVRGPRMPELGPKLMSMTTGSVFGGGDGTDPLDNTVIKQLASSIFEQIGLVGKEVEDAVRAYVSTLVKSRENLKDVALAPSSDIQNMLISLHEALATIDLTLEEAFSDPVAAYKLMGDKVNGKDFKKIAKADSFVKMFETLALFARDIANATVEQTVDEAIKNVREHTVGRLSGGADRAEAAGNATVAKPVVKPAVDEETRKGLFPKELGTKEELKVAVQALVEEIRQVGFSKELFLQATKRELQLIAGYLIGNKKDIDKNGNMTKVASRKATAEIADAQEVIEKYLGDVKGFFVETADYVTLQTESIASPVVNKPKEAEPVKEKVTKTTKKLDDVYKKMSDDFINELNFLSATLSNATSGEIPMLEVPVIEEKITQVSNDISEYLTNIAHLILEAINMPYDELVDLLNHLQGMPTDIRDQLSAATKLPFETMFEHIESLIIESVTEMADDAYDAILPVVNNTPAPSATLARTVAESIDYINQELSSFPQVKNYANIEDELQLLINKISTITEDELLSLQLALEKIMVDPSEIQNWTRIMGSNIQDIYDTISEQIKKLQTVVQNTTPPVIPATPAPTPATGGGSGSGGRKPPVTPPAGGAGGSGPFYPTPTGAPAPKIDVDYLNRLKAYKMIGMFIQAFAKVHLALAEAVLRVLPFGMTLWKVGAAAVGAVKGTYTFVKYLMQTGVQAKAAGSGLRGFIHILRTDATKAFTQLGTTIKEKLGNAVKSGAKGVGGTGRGFSNQMSMGMSQGINMATMNMGMAGMIGGNIVENLLRGLQSIPYVGGPAVAIIGTVTAAIALLTKTQKSWGSKSGDTVKNFTESWKKIKEIFKALLTPLEDFIGVLIGGTSTAVSGTDKARSKLESFSAWLNTTLTKVKVLVETKVAPAFRRFLAVVITVFRGFAAVFGGIFDVIGAKFDAATNKNKKRVQPTGKATSASAGRPATQADKDQNKEDADAKMEAAKKRLKEGIGKLTSAIGVMIKMLLMDLFIQVFKWAHQLLLNIIEIIPQLMLEAIRVGLKGILIVLKLFIKGFINIFTAVPKALALAFGKVIEWAGNLAGLISRIPGMGWLKGVAKGIKDFGKDMSGIQINWFDGILNAVDTGANAVSDAIDGSINAIKRRVGSYSNQVDGLYNGLKNFSKKKFGKQLNAVVKDVLPEGAGDGLFNSFKNMVTQAFKNPETAKAAGEALKDAIKSIADAKIKAKIEFDDSALAAVSEKLGGAVNKIKDELTEQLTAQKDASLKVFDDQIEAINALADAEAQLTATEQYESNRRKAIRDNELRRQNNRKDRSLAIYEGRIDDARSLDLQEIKDTQDFNDQVTELDTGRTKDLQSINRNNAVAIIKAQREDASKQFDQAIKDFEKFSTKLLENGTFTETQFKDQVEKMLTKAGTTSLGIQTTFTDLFTALPTKIQTGMDPITAQAGFFSTGLESLRTTAATKFGLATGVSDPNSILGITTGMLGGIGSSVSTAFAVGGPIQTSYGTGLDAINAYVKAKTTGTGPETTSSIFTQAITDAAAKMVAEAKSKERDTADAAGKLVTGINDALKKIQSDAMAKAVKEAVDAAGAAGIAAMKKAIADAKETAAGAGDGSKTLYFVRARTGGPFFSVSEGEYNGKYKDSTKYIKYTQVISAFNGGSIPYANGGKMKYGMGGMMMYGEGGPTFGPMNMGIPATLHGGEFVIRKKAVDKYGLDMLNQMNKGIYAPKVPSLNIPMASYSKIANAGSSQQISTSESNHNYNFYVDNFIGETEWFNTMMKEYNVKVVPANQKQAGLESRVVKSYNGINRGL